MPFSPADKEQLLSSALLALGGGLLQGGAPRVGSPAPGFGPGILALQNSLQSGRDNIFKKEMLKQELGIKEQSLALKNKLAGRKIAKEDRELAGEAKAKTFLFGDGTSTAGIISSLPKDQQPAIRALAEVNSQKAAEVSSDLLKKPNLQLRNAGGRVLGINPQTGEVIKDYGSAEDSGLTAIADAFSKSLGRNEAKAVVDLRGDVAVGLSLGKATRNALSDIKKSGGGAVSLTSALSRAGKVIQNEARTVAREFNVSLNIGDYDFGSLSNESATFKSSILNLAVMTARAQQGSRLSDRDVKDALRRVGGGNLDPEAAKAAMMRSLDESIGAIEDRIETTSIPENLRKGLLARGGLADRTRKILGPFKSSFRNPETTDQTPTSFSALSDDDIRKIGTDPNIDPSQIPELRKEIERRLRLKGSP